MHGLYAFIIGFLMMVIITTAVFSNATSDQNVRTVVDQNKECLYIEKSDTITGGYFMTCNGVLTLKHIEVPHK